MALRRSLLIEWLSDMAIKKLAWICFTFLTTVWGCDVLADNTEARPIGAIFHVQLGKRSAYLIASQHGHLTTRIGFSKELLQILDSANFAAFEARPDKVVDSLNAEYLSRANGMRLRDEIPEALAEKMSKRIKRLDASVPMWELLDRIPLQFAATVYSSLVQELLSRKQQTSSNTFPGIDLLLLEEARKRKWEIAEVEGVAGAFRATAALTNAESIEQLENVVDQLDQVDDATLTSRPMQVFLEYFYKGDLEEHYRHFRARECATPALASACDKQIDSRNAAIALGVEKLFTGRPKSPVIAIGALHLAGPNSVQSILEKRAFKVVRLF